MHMVSGLALPGLVGPSTCKLFQLLDPHSELRGCSTRRRVSSYRLQTAYILLFEPPPPLHDAASCQYKASMDRGQQVLVLSKRPPVLIYITCFHRPGSGTGYGSPALLALCYFTGHR
ncbi:hypothetical protein GE09DRAFT_1136596 [Coniochaeta sp. 2T2.1]|nr:hypothetical protein GE09DRAFT_1136596 [Coniochaeta sp. 2T2.1]